MDSVSNIYALRSAPHTPLPLDLSKLRGTCRPLYRPRIVSNRPPAAAPSNWRINALVEVVRKVRDKEDPDYDEINAAINKIGKQNYARVLESVLAKLSARDALFRLRVTTLLFDRGIRQNFYAPILADMYRDIALKNEDAKQDLVSQIGMFDTLYDVSKVVIVPPSTDPTFEEVIIAWTKQKETKRGFAVYTAELFTRGLLPDGTMDTMVKTVGDDLKDSIRLPKTPQGEEHVDHLVRFLFAITTKVSIVKPLVKEILVIPRTETPCLCMKSRFKLEDVGR